MSRILIQTALSLEFEAVKAFLDNLQIERHPSTGSIYNKGKYNGYEVLIVETGAGNVRSADETGRAIDFFRPDYMFFVGVAGGLKDVKIGDVVASSKIIGFEMGKDDIEFKPRLDTIPSSYILEQLAKHVKRENQWKQLIKVENADEPEVFVQPIAAGEKVVSSNQSVAFTYLKKYCSDAVAIDMEGNGFLVAARPHHAHAIEVRGISDLIENKTDADASGSQQRAAGNAAAFCFEMINQIETEEAKLPDTNSLEFRKKLVNELTTLYPQGPEQDDIWKRAGGDISILANSGSRKSQWFNAVEKLYLGGGGKSISISSLMNEVKEDYPNFISQVLNKKLE
jgi:adenosylhomocysteine nucleosidase